MRLLSIRDEHAREFYETEALSRYALDGLHNNVMAGEYRITLPDEAVLAAEFDRTR